MLSEVEISFLEKPTSKDELEVAEIIKTYARALKKHDSKILSSLFDKDARIDSYAAGGTVSFAQFTKAISHALPFITGVKFKDLLIKVKDGKDAVVHGATQYDHGLRNGRWNERIWEVTKNDNVWHIIRSKYNDFKPTITQHE